jgi:P4 family phage/plasmid primase-like protien
MGTLMKLLREDNLELFKELNRQSIQDNIVKFAFMDEKDPDLIRLVEMATSQTEYDSAMLFKKIFPNQFIYDTTNKMFYYFANHRWNKDSKEGYELKRFIPTVMVRICIKQIEIWTSKKKVAETAGDKDEVDSCDCKIMQYTALIQKYKKNNFQNNIISQLQVLYKKNNVEELLDSKTNLLGFENGVYDLYADVFRDGHPEDYLTFSCKYNYVKKDIDDPIRIELEKYFTNMMPNKENKDYLLDIHAYSLDGDKQLEIVAFWQGSGANGKGTTDALDKATFGDYHNTMDISVFTAKRKNAGGTSSELAKAKGKRLCVSTEPEEDEALNVGMLKKLSGRDRIECRGLYKECFEYVPQFMAILQMNNYPRLSTFDGGIKRRLRNIHFPYKFTDKPDPNNPLEKMGDSHLKTAFMFDELYAQAYMSMLLDRYRILRNKKFKIDTPKEVEASTNNYLESNNVVLAFLNDYFEDDKDGIVDKDTLVSLFKDFDKNAFQNWNWLKQQIVLNGYEVEKHKGGIYRDKQVVYGLKVRCQINEAEADEYDF